MPLPVGGSWIEVLDSDAYDDLPEWSGYNPFAVGNPAGLVADGPPLQGCPTSATLVIAANGLSVFARDRGG